MCVCFPAETTVTTKRGVKRLDELLAGDEFLTSSSKSGSSKWTEFYTWGHREPNTATEFLVIKLENDQLLKISPEHLLFVSGEKRKRIGKTAGQVTKGDKLFHSGGTTGSMDLLSVLNITKETITGVYAPFTMSGTFLANGILVSCYGDISNFELAHAFLAPLRKFHRIQPSKGESKDGINPYALKLMKVRNALPTSVRKWVS